jgi:nicotinamidase-related amidase
MRIGPTDQNSWTVADDHVDLVRPMIEPRPLRIPAEPKDVVIDICRTAVVVIDMQNDFCAPGGWFDASGHDLEPMRRPIPVLKSLLPPLRDAGVAVIWLNWGNRPDLANLPPSVLAAGTRVGQGLGYGRMRPDGRGPILERGSYGAQVIDDLEVHASDIVIHKVRFSGFPDTDFDSVLRNRQITTLLFAGINIDRCVLATLIDASFLGYDCLLIKDACSTPSPASCSEAVTFLVSKLYGFTVRHKNILTELARTTGSANAAEPRQQSANGRK